MRQAKEDLISYHQTVKMNTEKVGILLVARPYSIWIWRYDMYAIPSYQES